MFIVIGDNPDHANTVSRFSRLSGWGIFTHQFGNGFMVLSDD
jgi:hypothetical protein